MTTPPTVKSDAVLVAQAPKLELKPTEKALLDSVREYMLKKQTEQK